ncbi:uncharacterized protein V6R79_000190 [Siganus canaliculatus]
MKAQILVLLLVLVVGLRATTDESDDDPKVIPDDVAIPDILSIKWTDLQNRNDSFGESCQSPAGCHVIRRPNPARMSAVTCIPLPGQRHPASSVSSN